MRPKSQPRKNLACQLDSLEPCRASLPILQGLNLLIRREIAATQRRAAPNGAITTNDSTNMSKNEVFPDTAQSHSHVPAGQEQ